MISVPSVISCSNNLSNASRVGPQFACAAIVAILCASGCGDSSDAVPVQGNVSYRGEALSRGSVTFFPTAGRPVNVAISSDGSYSTELSPGEYIATVSYSEPLPAGYKEGDPVPAPKFILPEEYTRRTKSTLTASILADQDDPINFALE
jgi:hypothetical protein